MPIHCDRGKFPALERPYSGLVARLADGLECGLLTAGERSNAQPARALVRGHVPAAAAFSSGRSLLARTGPYAYSLEPAVRLWAPLPADQWRSAVEFSFPGVWLPGPVSRRHGDRTAGQR